MPTYTYITLGQAEADLASQLDDPTMQQWTAVELAVYWREALSTWNALTSFWRGRLAFPTVPGQVWYDLPAQVGSPRAYTATDQDVQQEIEYHLLEPLVAYPGAWTGSRQFSLSDLLGAWNRVQNETLMNGGCTLTVGTVNAPISGTVVLPDTFLGVKRVAWLPALPVFVVSPLEEADVWEKDLFQANWTIGPQQPPTTFLQSVEPPLRIEVDYIPPCAGDYEIVSVQSGTPSTGLSVIPLSLPPDWVWVAKWGTLAELLGKGATAQDPLRAAYAAKRYQEGLELMKGSPAVLDVRLNGLPINLDSVQNGDRFNAQWEGAPAGPAEGVYAMGMNLLAVSPPPPASAQSIVANVVVNAPLPYALGDFIQLGRDDYAAVLGYAQHLAMFKIGGEEFTSTIPFFQRFLGQAALYNKRLSRMGAFQSQIYAVSPKSEVTDA